MGTLYIVPTPLGNLEDITLRALRVLKSVSLIATEDTRTTSKLLNHFEISCPTLSYFEHSPPGQLERLLAALAEGDVALVSEAGTPLLSDPGYRLVQAATERGFVVVPLPGPSAITTALAGSGLPTDQFLFAGFLPRKASQRQKMLRELQTQPATLVFFEAPHRLLAALADLAEIFGANRPLAVCRELTKLHEELWRGTVAGALAEWHTREPRGEFTLVVAGAQPAGEWPEEQVAAALIEALAGGDSTKDAARHVAERSGWPKRKVYELAQHISNK